MNKHAKMLRAYIKGYNDAQKELSCELKNPFHKGGRDYYAWERGLVSGKKYFHYNQLSLEKEYNYPQQCYFASVAHIFKKEILKVYDEAWALENK